MALADEKYVLLTTFKRAGTAVSTPVWIVACEGESVGFCTSSGSGKAKRIAHTPRVTVQACDARGRVRTGSAPSDATARIVTGDEYEKVHAAVHAKYGAMVSVMKLVGEVRGTLKGKRIPYADVGLVITPAN